MSAWVRDYPVRFGEIDHAGVMYYPRFFDRMHRAFEDFWADALGRSYSAILDGDGVGFPVVDLQSRFFRPFRFGETMRVELTVTRIEATRLGFRYRLSAPGDERCRAEAEVTTAVIAMGTFRPAPLPEEHRAALQRYRGPGVA